MEILVPLEVRAARIPNGIERLRYLRQALHLRRRRKITASALALACVVTLSFSFNTPAKTAAPAPTRQEVRKSAPPPKLQPLEPVWMAEQHGDHAAYSNGLQIRTDYLTPSNPRQYRAYSRDSLTSSELRSAPAGIVFHTTESLILPLEPSHNGSLLQTREDLLRHVKKDRLYNFVIDRYGVVFRIVAEDQVAHHAGHSVWADARSIYVDLNESFIGIAFEAQTGRDADMGTAFEPSPAQIRSGRLLTDLLRGAYSLPESNCVTHAQVSVNPQNMRFGYHTDWAANFPFHDLGLSSGYGASIPAVEIFGFVYDQTFLHDIGGQAWEGLSSAERRILEGARQRGMTPAAYRSSLQKQYRSIRSLNHDQIAAANRT